MITLVTGGLGFVGSNLVDELVSQGHDVHVWDDLSSESSSLNHQNVLAKYVINDVRNILDDMSLHPKYDVIFHLAARARIQPSFTQPIEYLSNDIMGTAMVCELARKMNAKVVYAGSSTAYAGPMLNPYAFAKFTGEQVCEMYNKVFNISTCVARFFNVYGPRHPKTGQWATVIGIFENLYAQKMPMTVTGTGEQRRDFTHVADIVSGLIAMSEIDGTCQILNLGTGSNFSLNEVANMFSRDIKYLPARPGEAWITLADIKNTQETLAWSPKINLSNYIQDWKNDEQNFRKL